jgi:hypothetical protein
MIEDAAVLARDAIAGDTAAASLHSDFSRRSTMNFAAADGSKASRNLAERPRFLSRRRVEPRPINGHILVLPLPLCGCSEAGAPSLDIFGAFFPAWLLCAVLGIFVAITARVFFTDRTLTAVLPYQLFVCTSIGTIFALLVWLICFGR